MSNTTSMTRKDQAQRRREVYIYFKKLSKESEGKNILKELIYKEVADKFNYMNVTSVKSIIRELKLEEEKQNEINLHFGKGIVETVLVSQVFFLGICDFDELNFKYSLEHSKDIENTIFISGTYTKSNESIASCFDHFTVTDIKSAVARISNLLQECYQNYN